MKLNKNDNEENMNIKSLPNYLKICIKMYEIERIFPKNKNSAFICKIKLSKVCLSVKRFCFLPWQNKYANSTSPRPNL